MHTFCDSRPYLRVIGTGYLTVHSKFGVSLMFGTGVIVCQGNTAMQGFHTWGGGEYLGGAYPQTPLGALYFTHCVTYDRLFPPSKKKTCMKP